MPSDNNCSTGHFGSHKVHEHSHIYGKVRQYKAVLSIKQGTDSTSPPSAEYVAQPVGWKHLTVLLNATEIQKQGEYSLENYQVRTGDGTWAFTHYYLRSDCSYRRSKGHIHAIYTVVCYTTTCANVVHKEHSQMCFFFFSPPETHL